MVVYGLSNEHLYRMRIIASFCPGLKFSIMNIFNFRTWGLKTGRQLMPSVTWSTNMLRFWRRKVKKLRDFCIYSEALMIMWYCVLCCYLSLFLPYNWILPYFLSIPYEIKFFTSLKYLFCMKLDNIIGVIYSSWFPIWHRRRMLFFTSFFFHKLVKTP